MGACNTASSPFQNEKPTRPVKVDDVVVVIVIAYAVGLAVATFSLARRQLLSFRYAIGWLGFLLGASVLSLFSPLVEPIANFVGVSPAVVVAGSSAAALLVICLQLSISISGLQDQVRRLSEEVALREDAPNNGP